MKIQTKKGILRVHRNDLSHLHNEKRALSMLNHPFIIRMHYAFHTDALAVMVVELATGGDLKDRLKSYNGAIMPIEDVTFYAAEIVCALVHLHSKHLIFRDLKPRNVLLNCDGHIQLADFGGVMDESGHVLRRSADEESMLPLLSCCISENEHQASNDFHPDIKNFRVFGTKGYVKCVALIPVN